MANFNFNKVILGGRLTADPELRTTSSGTSVTSFGLAINRKGKDGEQAADFFNVTAWRATAEFVTRFFGKGASICVVGSLRPRDWTDNNGVRHFTVDVIADEAFFVDSKGDASRPPVSGAERAGEDEPARGSAAQGPRKEANAGSSGAAAPKPTSFSTPNAVQRFDEIDDDSELPF